MNRKTSIIIITYNNLSLTKKCLSSIKRYTPKDTYELIVIDNNSQDKTKEYLQKEASSSNMKVLFNKENVGFPKACNQGIKLASKKNDILLLNNDTIVTYNWLTNLQKCLHSSKQIGAVGAVCNQNENRQGAEFTYDDLKTMQTLAKKNNISDSSRWEEKTFLIGFCLLIKRKVMNKLKKLDENYSPGYIEDNDLSLRILKKGYKLMLCHDCFIHHYLGTSFRKDLTSFYRILYKNRDYFLKKWHFNTFVFDEYKDASIPFIEDNLKVLELNSGIGVNSLALKYKYKNISLAGVEEDKFKRLISKKVIPTYKSLQKAPLNYYDCILLGNFLEEITDITSFLNEVKRHLKKDGFIIGEFNNISNIKSINDLLQGKNNFEKKRTFSPNTLEAALRNTFQVTNYFKWYQTLTPDEKRLYSLIKDKALYLDYTYYTFKAVVAKEK